MDWFLYDGDLRFKKLFDNVENAFKELYKFKSFK